MSRDVHRLPTPLQPPTVPLDTIKLSHTWRLESNEPVAAQLEFQKDVERRLSKAIRAGGDANELARLEMLGYMDAAGYLHDPTVYSEVLERFVPESEAL